MSSFCLFKKFFNKLRGFFKAEQVEEVDNAIVAAAIKLNRDAFTEIVEYQAIRIPKQKCTELIKKFKKYCLDKPKTRYLVNDPGNDEYRFLILKEEFKTKLTDDLKEMIAQESLEIVPYKMTIDYSHYNAEQVLKKLLPAGIDVPTSFETVGHIAHLNLRDHQLPYRFLIGEVLLDKNHNIRTVVNKVGSIENEFRVFEMEVIAGDRVLESEVVQHGVRFRFDYEKVYWNSRLETEHKRLIHLIKPGEILVDLMAGVGPFAVPAALHSKALVLANDLNPYSAAYLQKNAVLNRVGRRVTPFNMDARAFLRLLDSSVSEVAAHQMAPLTPEEVALLEKGSDSDAFSRKKGEVRNDTIEAEKGVEKKSDEVKEVKEVKEERDLTTAELSAGKMEASKVDETKASKKNASKKAAAAAVIAPPPPPPPPLPTPKNLSWLTEVTESLAEKVAVTRKSTAAAAAAATSKTHLTSRDQVTDSAVKSVAASLRGSPSHKLLYHHVVMNLPASAVEFLDAFAGSFDPAVWKDHLPRVHCYTFRRSNETDEDVIATVERFLGGPLDSRPEIHIVRDVAPQKIMLCVSFTVPRAVAFRGRLSEFSLEASTVERTVEGTAEVATEVITEVMTEVMTEASTKVTVEGGEKDVGGKRKGEPTPSTAVVSEESTAMEVDNNKAAAAAAAAGGATEAPSRRKRGSGSRVVESGEVAEKEEVVVERRLRRRAL
mmetsp:Transcript_9601/g.17955  ORF Transcript_9601/g.17955 Transcript_9601/m.17955 type:complete len:716 (-) Transcript_9601:57-2204(-)